MKNNLSRAIIIMGDITAIFFALVLSYFTRHFFDAWVSSPLQGDVWVYTGDLSFYAIVLVTLLSEKIY